MSNRNTHLVAGCITGIGTYFALKHMDAKEINLKEVIFTTSGGMIGGVLPDLLDPPISPNHRGFAHSFSLGILLGFGIEKVYKYIRNVEFNKNEVWFNIVLLIIMSLLIGYLSHLVLDVGTPKGLPLI
jgi:membrane-bound metal-dependent hydrolase YbcI (DUF457 family)